MAYTDLLSGGENIVAYCDTYISARGLLLEWHGLHHGRAGQGGGGGVSTFQLHVFFFGIDSNMCLQTIIDLIVCYIFPFDFDS